MSEVATEVTSFAEVVARRRQRRNVRRLVAAGLALVVCATGALGVRRSLAARLDAVRRDDSLAAVLSPADDRFVNILLVGSDSREGADPNDPDFGNVGGTGDVQGRRSDTLIVMNVERSSGIISLLSIPRDLWVEIGDSGGSDRINTAYRDGSAVVVRTVQRALGIPVHHYLEINFQGFKSLVDAVGGVTVCVEYPTRDRNTGLFIPVGCKNLDGVGALAWARSRYFEEKIDGSWRMDGSSDIGRGKRQRHFVALLMKTAIERTLSNPFRAGTVLSGATDALLVDPTLDVVEFASIMRPAATGKLRRFALGTYGDTVGDASVLRLDASSGEVLGFFAGTGPAPVPSE
jgi:LCP family protein required for cell wall assembly